MSNWATLADLPIKAMKTHFGRAMTYTCTGESATSIIAPFDEAFEEQDFDSEGVPLMARRPVIDVRLADLPAAPSHDDVVAIGARTFRVSEVRAGAQSLSAKCFLLETT